MNKVYRTVWNEHTNTWVAVQETAKARGKSSKSGGFVVSELGIGGSRFMMTAAASAVLLMSGQAVAATGGQHPLNPNTGNYCYYDTTSESVICGDAATNTADTPGGKTAKSVVLGKGAANTGESNVAIGISASSAGTSSVAVGDRAKAGSDQTIAVGQNAQANARWDVSIGRQAGWNAAAPAGANPEGRNVAIGDAALKNGLDVNNNNVMGTSAGENLKGSHNVIIGTYANAAEAIQSAENNGSTKLQINSKTRTVSIIDSVNATKEVNYVETSNSVAIGHRALTTKAAGVAIGQQAKAFGNTSTAVGNGSRALGDNAVAMGNTANAGSGSAIAIGLHANYDSTANTAEAKYRATGASSVAIGARTHAGATHAVTIGTEATTSTTGQGSVAVGSFSKAVGINAAAVGQASQASGQNSFAGGNDSHAVGTSAVSLGDGAGKGTATFANGVKTGGDYASGDSSTAVGTYTKAAGVGATALGVAADAQTFRSAALGAYSTAKGGNSALAAGDSATANGAKSTAIGHGSTAEGTSNIAIGDKAYTHTGQGGIAIGSQYTGLERDGVTQANTSSVKAWSDNAIAIGTGAEAGLDKDNKANTNAGKTGAVAIGTRALAYEVASVALGEKAGAFGYASTALGTQATANNRNGVAVGTDATAEAENSVSIGYASTADGTSAVAIGDTAKTSQQAHAAVVIGSNAKTELENAVALGSYSTADRNKFNAAPTAAADATFASGKVYSLEQAAAADVTAIENTAKDTYAAVSVGGADAAGKVFTRQIINVAAGSDDSDAVNVAQLKAVGNQVDDIKLQAAGNTTALGGGAKYDPANNAYTAPTYTVVNAAGTPVTYTNAAGNAAATTANNVGDAVTQLNTYINQGWQVLDNGGAVKGTVTPGDKVQFVNGNGTTANVTTEADGVTKVTFDVAATPAIETTTLAHTDGKVNVPNAPDNSKMVTAEGIANAINNSGFTLTTQGEPTTASLVNPGETVDLSNDDGNIIITKGSGDNNVNFSLADTVKIGPAANPITINGTERTISGLVANLPVTTSTGTPTTAQLAPANPAIGNAATVGDVLNAGWNLQVGGAPTDFVRPYDTVNFVGANGATVTTNTDGAQTTITIGMNAQGQAESAQLPVVYTDAAGQKVTKQPDGKFYLVDPATGLPTATEVLPADVIASMQGADGKTVNAPVKLANVAPGVNDTDAVNVSQLKGAADALGGGAAINPDGSFKAPSYVINKTDGTQYAPANNVGDALKNLNDEVVKPITFGGDTGAAFDRTLGSTVNVKGGATGTLTDGNIGVEASNGTLNVKLAESINLGNNGSVVMGDTKVDANGLAIIGGPSITKSDGINAGGKQITNVASGGDVDTNGANIGDVRRLAAAAAAAADTSASVSAGSTSVTVTKGATTNGVTDYAVDLSQAAKDSLAKADTAVQNVVGDSNITAQKNGDTVNLSLAPVVNIGPAQGGNPVTINGNAGTIGGLTNKAFDPTNFVSGQAATEDQLAQVATAAGKRNTVSAGSNIVVTPTTANGVTNYQVATNPNMTLTSVTTTDAAGNQTVTNGNGVTITPAAQGKAPVSLTGDGLNNGGNKITNVAEGTAGTDAVNVDQLNKAINNVNVTIPGQLQGRLNGIENRVNQVENTANAGVAQAIATAGLPQAYLPGKSMVAVGGGYYKGETGYAVGFSTISDGGNWIIKGTASGNSRGHFGASVGAGYQW